LNRFILNTTSTGSSAKIVVTGDDSNFLSSSAGDGSNNLNLMLKGDGTVYNGNDAMLDFGDMQNITSSSNTVTVNGVTLQLKQGGGSIGTVTVAPNSEAVFNSIKDFVNNYNDAIDKINKKVAERRYTDYPPLIDEQKNAMGEEEIKKWESLARSGLLRNDMLLRGIVNKMRTSMHTSFAGTTGANNLSALGITTGSYVEKGKLQINETKLKEAIQKDPTGVMDLFTRASDNSNEKGIAARIYDDLNSTITLIASKAGNEYSLSSVDNSVIGRRMTEIDSEIESWHDRLDRVESRYIAQFTALEKAIGTLNSQSSWLAQMLGSK
jgi:flagellar hook-associated protein 2